MKARTAGRLRPSSTARFQRPSGARRDGLRSQETRCTEFAKQKGLPVLKVFRDAGVSGVVRATDRPASKELFAFLDVQREPVFVIIDDLSRLAVTRR